MRAVLVGMLRKADRLVGRRSRWERSFVREPGRHFFANLRFDGMNRGINEYWTSGYGGETRVITRPNVAVSDSQVISYPERRQTTAPAIEITAGADPGSRGVYCGRDGSGTRHFGQHGEGIPGIPAPQRGVALIGLGGSHLVTHAKMMLCLVAPSGWPSLNIASAARTHDYRGRMAELRKRRRPLSVR